MSEKADVLRLSNKYASNVRKASSDCKKSSAQIKEVISKIRSNWKGDGADAMVTFLTRKSSELDSISSRLSSISSQMKTRGQSVYNNWVDDDSDDAD